MKTILVDAVDTFVVEKDGMFKVGEEMHHLLESYPNRKIVVSNANDEQIPLWNLDKLPYELFTLKHNPDKTDPEYFNKMLQHFGLSKDDVIYFEHNPEAVKSAESVGIKTHYYDSEKKDLESLKVFLDTNL
ncbi:MAG: hypothetical protein UX31_C0001G0023 [Candidatus Nomurabacteria bacterium GW2011_GWA1_46_11]|uniref:Haloacid dehalogenase n=2 Tax=Parcubacteria group TaxID=1794811 RepID=A0A1F8EYW4_9BACT|nr:MAG: hypothetical protein UX31_C0001G0023 [Candidatus Nomurabacteria bacterium GW2011_GWA1_46_11]OGN06055.1 MAG: hypothetical protein A2669_00800 [Candidatus Yanofskybacteria bacterium RIFCSPHIGHO2_01_FULL_48_25b]